MSFAIAMPLVQETVAVPRWEGIRPGRLGHRAGGATCRARCDHPSTHGATMPTRSVRQLARGIGIGLGVCTMLGLRAGGAAAGQRRGREVRTPTVSGPVTGGEGLNHLGPDVSGAGYQQDEYFVA